MKILLTLFFSSCIIGILIMIWGLCIIVHQSDQKIEHMFEIKTGRKLHHG